MNAKEKIKQSISEYLKSQDNSNRSSWHLALKSEKPKKRQPDDAKVTTK